VSESVLSGAQPQPVAGSTRTANEELVVSEIGQEPSSITSPVRINCALDANQVDHRHG
jgi:hypothetical protein